MPSTVRVLVPAGARTGPFGIGIPSGPIDERAFASASPAADNDNASMPAPSSQRFTRVRIVSADVRLLAVIERLQRHPWRVLAVGISLEALVMGVIGDDDALRGVRGIGGESAVLLAVVGAVFAGPTVGVAMAATGWALFFPLIANSHPSSIVALPIWVVSAYLVGAMSTALVRAERERERVAQQHRAAHALRAPIATIHGLVQVLRRDGTREEALLRSVEDETERLLRSPIFEGD